MFAVPIKVVNDIVEGNNVIIELQSGNFMSNLTITYGPCSGEPNTTLQFQSPVVHLNNLIADTTYCYSITYNKSNTTSAGDKAVVVPCDGTFMTAAEATSTPTTLSPITPSPTTGIPPLVTIIINTI